MLRLDTYQKPENLVAGQFQSILDEMKIVILDGWSIMC